MNLQNVRQIITQRPYDQSVTIDVGTRGSYVRITVNWHEHDAPLILQALQREAHRVNSDLMLLYQYLAEEGRVIHLSLDIAKQTIAYLKETN